MKDGAEASLDALVGPTSSATTRETFRRKLHAGEEGVDERSHVEVSLPLLGFADPRSPPRRILRGK